MRWSYLTHLLFWIMPVILAQWFLGARTFVKNWRAIVFPTLILGTYLSLIDSIAVASGIWFFDPQQNLGIFLGPLPVEEILFFFLTSWLVAQSLVLLLPARFKH